MTKRTFAVVLAFGSVAVRADTVERDFVVYGATPAGIAAAVQAGRMGIRAVLIEPSPTIGGLTTGGLGQTDIGNKDAFGGIARQFYRDVKAYYGNDAAWKFQKRNEYRPKGQSVWESGEDSMWTFEPSAATAVLEGWIRDNGVELRRQERLDREPGGVVTERGRIVSLRTESGTVYCGKVFADCSYEGDLMAAAGVSYVVGREANATYGETIDGVERALAKGHQFRKGVDPYVVKGDPKSGLLPYVGKDCGEADGQGDRRIQAYCFRMCLTDCPENRIPFKKPEGYRELDYELLFRNFEAGESAKGGLPWINSPMPNRKTDTNNSTGFSTDFIGMNWKYPEASYAEREKIVEAHLKYQQGLMWTLANHPRVPERVRAEVSRWGTCKDEFRGERGDGWQNQLYVREARRLVGTYVMTEHNCRGKVRAPHPVAMGAYGMDSHNVRRYVGKDGFVHNEGNIEDSNANPPHSERPFRRLCPYPIDYGAIVPKRGECANLFVPVCVSASHMAFGSIRMEPVFFTLGQVAATAAAQAIAGGCAVQDVDYAALRDRLVADGVVVADALGQAELRAKALCAQMTLEEKAGELMVYDYNDLGTNRWDLYRQYVDRNEIGAMMRVLSPSLARKMQEYKLAHSRLKIPLIVHEDITHGWATTLPIQLAMACSWDDAAVEKAEAVAAREAAAIGIQMTYSPQCDVSCDPRWGRIGGTHGEDPYLVGRIAAARVRGDQGRTFGELTDGRHVISCVKHFVGYGSLQGGKDYRHLDFSRRELFETHLPPFRAAIDAGALAVMNAYTVFEGVPCNFNRYLLTDLLRGQLGFRGQLVTDWTTLTFSIDEGAATSREDAAVRGLAAGVDMDMIARAFLLLPKLVREGKVAEKDLDVPVVRSLALKYLMGLFDDPYRFCDEGRAKAELFCERNRREVLELTRESLVLLKNDGRILPLDPSEPVALAGTWADDESQLRGGLNKDFFSDFADDGSHDLGLGRAKVTTIKDALAARWSGRLECATVDPIKIARGEAKMPDARTVVLTIGEPSGFTGERRGRATLSLPESELEQLRALKRVGKRVVSVVFAGRPFLMNEIAWLSDAVLLVWYPGAMGGEAIGEILSGETNPSGKLAHHIPLHPGQIPLSYREKRTFIPCSYADIPATPLYPFGYGLSYATFEYSKPTSAKASYEVGEPVTVAVRVKNTGNRRGREVVQLYVRDEVASVLPRERELREFSSVWLEPGEEKKVLFTLRDEAFALYDKDLRRVVETGDYTLFIGPDSMTTNSVRISLR